MNERIVSGFATGSHRADGYDPPCIEWLGAVRMPKRFWAFLYGTEDAVPGDYVLALIATVGLMAAILMGMI